MLPRNAVCVRNVFIQRLVDERCLVTGADHVWDRVVLEFFIPESVCPAAPQYTPGEKGAFAKELWTYCAVNNNDGTEKWYGFVTWEQREFFLCLMKADGVGPGSAYKIMNASPWNIIATALATNDQDGFRKLKGVGPKTADKLIPIVFKDKPATSAKAKLTEEQKLRNVDAVATLVALGRKKVEASVLVTDIQSNNPDMTTEQLVKAALKR